MKMIRAPSFVLTLYFCSSVFAASESQILFCNMISEPVGKTISPEINLDEHTVKIGDIFSDIIQLDDMYLTAVSRHDHLNVGAESLVLNRVTGQLERAAVYIAATSETILQPSERYSIDRQAYIQNLFSNV